MKIRQHPYPDFGITNAPCGLVICACLVFGLALPAAPSRADDWTTYQYNVLHTGYNDHDQIAPPLWIRWMRQIHTNPRELDQITVVGERAYVSTGAFLEPYAVLPGVRCLHAKTGSLLWEYTCSTGSTCDDLTQVSCGYGRVYFQRFWGTNSKLFAFDTLTGDELFAATFPVQNPDFYAPAPSSPQLAVGSSHLTTKPPKPLSADQVLFSRSRRHGRANPI